MRKREEECTVTSMATVANWNVLADAYALPERYAEVGIDDLRGPQRAARVRAALEELASSFDIVTVQEADPELASWCSAHFHAVHAPRPDRGGKPGKDGVLLLSARPLNDPQVGASIDGRRVWAGATQGGVAYVAAHLDWDDDSSSPHAGAIQAAELVAWVSATFPGVPCVIGADINAHWESQVGSVLANAGFFPSATGEATALVAGNPRELDILCAKGTVLRPRSLWTLPKGHLPNGSIPSDHIPLAASVGI